VIISLKIYKLILWRSVGNYSKTRKSRIRKHRQNLIKLSQKLRQLETWVLPSINLSN